ncbi:MAG: hypothetical protein V4850_27805 [Myxococcota bacterium]
MIGDWLMDAEWYEMLVAGYVLAFAGGGALLLLRRIVYGTWSPTP